MLAKGVNRSLVKMMAKTDDNDQEAQFSFPNPFAKKKDMENEKDGEDSEEKENLL